MSKGRSIAWLLVLLSIAMFAAAIGPLSRRIQAFNKAAGFLNLHAEPINSRQIRIDGFPDGALTDDAMPDGSSAVRLDFAGKATLIPVKSPPATNLPNLSGYDEWLKVLAIYEVTRDDAGNPHRKPGSERLLIVVRHTPEGYNPDAEGEVRRNEWQFSFYDLKKDGSIATSQRRWPRSSSYGDPEKKLAKQAAGEGTPQQVETARRLIAIEPLKDRTVEYFAAMHVIPKLAVPYYKFNDTAFRLEVLGWTLPASMCAVLLFTGSFVFAIAPRRKRPK